MIDLSKFGNISYLLDPNPTYQFMFFWPLLVVGVITFATGIIIAILRLNKLEKVPWAGPIGQWLRWFGFAALFLLFCRYEALPFLSIRLILLIVMLGFLVWLGYIVRVLRSTQPHSDKKTIRNDTYEKYLPRPKKR